MEEDRKYIAEFVEIHIDMDEIDQKFYIFKNVIAFDDFLQGKITNEWFDQYECEMWAYSYCYDYYELPQNYDELRSIVRSIEHEKFEKLSMDEQVFLDSLKEGDIITFYAHIGANWAVNYNEYYNSFWNFERYNDASARDKLNLIVSKQEEEDYKNSYMYY